MKRKKAKAGVFRNCRLIFTAAIFFLAILSVIKIIRDGTWDGKRRFTVVLDGSPIILFSIEPISRQAVLVPIPENTMLDVPYGYSTYPASAVFRLGSLDPKRSGGKLLSKSMENTFGVLVDGFFAQKGGDRYIFPVQSSTLPKFKKEYFSLTSAVSALFKFQAVSGNLATNLSIIDILRLWNSVRSLRADQINVIDLAKNNALRDGRLADGTTVKILDRDALDKVLFPDFQDQPVRMQNITVEVVNATDTEKVAGQFSRILQNMGGSVVATTTAKEAADYNCKILLSRRQLRSSIIVDRLERSYRCTVEEDSGVRVADLKIVLGGGFIK